MFTKGKLTSGNRSMPSLVNDTTPSTMKLMMTIVAKTGRRMEISEIHMSSIHENRIYLRPDRHILPGVGNDHIARLQTVGDLYELAGAQSFADGHLAHGIALDPERHALPVSSGDSFPWNRQHLRCPLERNARGAVHARQQIAAWIADPHLDAEVTILRV